MLLYLQSSSSSGSSCELLKLKYLVYTKCGNSFRLPFITPNMDRSEQCYLNRSPSATLELDFSQLSPEHPTLFLVWAYLWMTQRIKILILQNFYQKVPQKLSLKKSPKRSHHQNQQKVDLNYQFSILGRRANNQIFQT